MLILICDAFDAAMPAKLAAFGEVTDDKARLPEATVALIRSKTKGDREFIEKGVNLKVIIRGGVGTDNIDKVAAKEKGILVMNTPKSSAIAVAELAFAMMIAVPCKILEGHNGMVQGKFLKNELKRTELYGKTLGLVGLGNIATELAKRAAAFGMKVKGIDPAKTSHEIATVVSTLDELVDGCDYISLHTPLTPETQGMINAALIAKMKKGVVLVNTGRGKCIHEADLVEALKSGYVAAYATDVWTSDPPPADCPLLAAPNVLMMPHLGASTKENLGRISNETVELLENLKKEGKI